MSSHARWEKTVLRTINIDNIESINLYYSLGSFSRRRQIDDSFKMSSVEIFAQSAKS